MNETLLMMRKAIKPELKNRTDDDLVREYQLSCNPAILAYLFNKHFNLMAAVCNNFTNLTSEDKASICMERLDACVLKFNFKNKFTTFLHACLFRELRRNAQELDCYKRKANYKECDSYDRMLEDVNFELTAPEKNVLERLINEDHNLDLMMYLESLNLTEFELKYCDLILDNFEYSREMAKQLKVGCIRLSEARDSLKKKLSSKGLKSFCTCP